MTVKIVNTVTDFPMTPENSKLGVIQVPFDIEPPEPDARLISFNITRDTGPAPEGTEPQYMLNKTWAQLIRVTAQWVIEDQPEQEKELDSAKMRPIEPAPANAAIFDQQRVEKKVIKFYLTAFEKLDINEMLVAHAESMSLNEIELHFPDTKRTNLFPEPPDPDNPLAKKLLEANSMTVEGMTGSDTMTQFEIGIAKAAHNSGWMVNENGWGYVRSEWLQEFRKCNNEAGDEVGIAFMQPNGLKRLELSKHDVPARDWSQTPIRGEQVASSIEGELHQVNMQELSPHPPNPVPETETEEPPDSSDDTPRR